MFFLGQQHVLELECVVLVFSAMYSYFEAKTAYSFGRNGGHMCVWDPLILILIGTLGCVVLNTVLCSGVCGKKVEQVFSTGVLTAMRRLQFLAQRYSHCISFILTGQLYHPAFLFFFSNFEMFAFEQIRA